MADTGKFNIKFWDYSKEGSSVAFYPDLVTAGNIAAIDALNGALLAAIQNLTLGNIAQTMFVAEIVDNGQNFPSDANAHRERKWLLNMVDLVTGDPVTATIPTADVTGGHLQLHSDEADMTHADWVALKDAIDGNYNNPKTGNAVELVSARKVGRNL